MSGLVEDYQIIQNRRFDSVNQFKKREVNKMTFPELDVAEERAVFIANAAGEPVIEKKLKGIVNVSKGMLAAVTSVGYNTIQHNEVRSDLFTALTNLNIAFVPSIREQGHRVYIDVSFPDAVVKLTQVGEEFASGVRVINSYDKTTGLIIVPRIVRLKCTNGMVLKTFGEGVVLKHNSSIVKDIQANVETALKSIINGHQNLQKMVDRCIADSIEWKLAEKIIKKLIGREKHIEAIKKLLPESEVVTRWDIYNALTDYATHSEQISPNIEAWLQSRAEILLNKPLLALVPPEFEAEGV